MRVIILKCFLLKWFLLNTITACIAQENEARPDFAIIEKINTYVDSVDGILANDSFFVVGNSRLLGRYKGWVYKNEKTGATITKVSADFNNKQLLLYIRNNIIVKSVDQSAGETIFSDGDCLYNKKADEITAPDTKIRVIGYYELIEGFRKLIINN